MAEPLKTTCMSHGCIVMASGQGSRFGGNKLMVHLAGKPLIGHVLDATEGLFKELVVVTRHEDVAEYCKGRGVGVVLHDEPHRNDTVRLGMPLVDRCSDVAFVQGDQPLIARSSIAGLLECAEADADSIWRMSFEGTPGAPVLFPEWTFDELRTLPEGAGGGFVVKKYPEHVRLAPVRDEIELADVDTADDLAALERYLAEKGVN